MKHATRKFAIGAILAAIGGYIAGILTAPKSGKETRRAVKEAADTAIAETEKQLKKLHTELAELIDTVKERGGELEGKARADFDATIEKSKLARQKIRELLSTLHEGDADDKDLQKAIDGAAQSIKHLKTYLTKHA